MKKITLTFKEFYLFKLIAKFHYNFSISTGIIIIEADAYMLEDLGY